MSPLGSAHFNDDTEYLARLARIEALLEGQAKQIDTMRDDFADTVRLIVNGQFREVRAEAKNVTERLVRVEQSVDTLKRAEGENAPIRRIGYWILGAILVAVMSALLATVITAPLRAPVDVNRTSQKGLLP